MIKFQVKNRFTDKVQFTAEIDCSEDTQRSIKLGLAVKWAIKNKANLQHANLWGANLRGANLRGANLRDANLRSSNLQHANLWDADLQSADLQHANLWGADLQHANLGGANLQHANLQHANLRSSNLQSANLQHANLWDANLRDANLQGADLQGAGINLRPFKACLWLTLSLFSAEAAGVAKALREGRVNGSSYSGECACLIGTVANIKGVGVDTLPQRSSDPSEQWFLMISEGDTPDKDTPGGRAAKQALEWVGEWLAIHGSKDA